ncbi:hypothetical protein COCVIDRAFT_111213, partial [Bipolaris victoriae FI3]
PSSAQKKFIRLFSANESPTSRKWTTATAFKESMAQKYPPVLAAAMPANPRSMTSKIPTASSQSQEISNFARLDSRVAA